MEFNLDSILFNQALATWALVVVSTIGLLITLIRWEGFRLWVRNHIIGLVGLLVISLVIAEALGLIDLTQPYWRPYLIGLFAIALASPILGWLLYVPTKGSVLRTPDPNSYRLAPAASQPWDILKRLPKHDPNRSPHLRQLDVNSEPPTEPKTE